MENEKLRLKHNVHGDETQSTQSIFVYFVAILCELCV